MTFTKIHKVAAVVMMVCGFVLSSCEPEAEPIAPEISLKSEYVSAEAGSVFVTVKSAGEWTISVEYPGPEKNWASLSVYDGVGDRNNIILTYGANESEQERSLRLVVISGDLYGELTLTQAAKGEVAPPDKPDPEPDPEPEPPVVDPTVITWLELPEMGDDTGLEYYSHFFDKDGVTYRNYTFGWSQGDMVALWMAYPLCKFYTNKVVDRTNAWAYDPLLGIENSPAPFGGYGEELARGHQVPSADRLCCYDANAQTFYGTNMTPQLNQHNEGIWSDLEGAVRTWANTSDTTYVVTGCVVEGSTRTTHDSDDWANNREAKSVTVPVAYYKALIRYHKASTISQWAGIAFYTEHKDYGAATVRSVSMSIDELEEIVGIDFFVNLPTKLGVEKAAEIEAQNPDNIAIWW